MSANAGAESRPPVAEVTQLADHLFRKEAGKLISVLTGLFGIERLQLAEDVVQEALIRAMQSWPYYGVPKNPAAWLTQTAKNLALDILRREQNFNAKQSQIIASVEDWSRASEECDSARFDNEIRDRRLQLMFACCHPSLSREFQTALALKTLCGLNPAEIASAFLTTEAAILKRLTRARQKIQELRLKLEIPDPTQLPERLEGVLQTLYFLFNEGYKASHGESLIREELCREAIELGALLATHPAGDTPRAHALVALMLLNAARLPARTDADGNILRLQEQDRSLWDGKLIARGMQHFARSGAGRELTEYHLQAAIAAVHCAAASYDQTDWGQILFLYDQLARIDPSPVVELNRAVALAQVHGPRVGLSAIEKLKQERTLESYYLLYAVMAEFESQLQEFDAAAENLRKALRVAEQKSEREFLERKLQDCGGSGGSRRVD